MSVSKNAFESKAAIPAAKYVEVQAVDSHHNVMRTSSVVRGLLTRRSPACQPPRH